MRKILAIILAAAMMLSLSAVYASAHPKAIREKTFELKTDTIFVKESTLAGSSYTVEYTNPQTSTDDAYKMYILSSSDKPGGFAVLRVDISSVKQASDFALNFSFTTSTTKNSALSVYCADYEAGKSLFSSLNPGDVKTNVGKPAVHNTATDMRIYKYTTESKKDVEIELSARDFSLLKEHVESAIKSGNDSVYFLVAVTSGDYFYLYNSASADKAPSLTVTGSSISSEVEKTEDGYIYKVGGLADYADCATVVIAAYGSGNGLINIATSGSVTTAKTETVEACIACNGAERLMAYVLCANTLEPLTYPEEIVLADI